MRRRAPGGTDLGPGRRRRRSLTLQVFAVLAASLLGGVSASLLIDEQLTRSTLADEARRVVASEADRVQGDLVALVSRQTSTLRIGTRSVRLRDAILRGDRSEVVSTLSDLRQDAEVASLTLSVAGQAVPFTVGPSLEELPEQALARSQVLLWRLASGRHALVIVEVIGESNATLVAATPFDDGLARFFHSARDRDVILVADNRIAGASYLHDGGLPPGATETDGLPVEPVVAEVLDEPRFVAYIPLALGQSGVGFTGAVGIASTDPVATLDVSLSRVRAIVLALLVLAAGALSALLLRFVTRPARALADTAQKVADGDFAAEFAEVPGGELGDLATALDRMRMTLRDQVAIMGDQADALREASERLVNVRDEDRRRLAQGLHDGLQQRLVLLRMRVQTLAEADLPEHRATLAEELRGLLVELREISQDLYPSILRDRGLVGALRSLAGRSTTPIALHVQPEPFPRLDPELEANAYFLAAEAITNALKYSDAATIDVHVEVDDRRLLVVVADDGHGFGGDVADGMGLRNMRDRALAFHGHCEVETGPDGTTVTAVFPVLSTALEEQQDGGDAAVEVIRVR